MKLPIDLPMNRLADFCQRYHVRSLSLFGSVLRSDFRPQSDVDILLDFEPEHMPGLIRLMQMQDELAILLGRSVDLLTPGFLPPAWRQQVERDALRVYGST